MINISYDLKRIKQDYYCIINSSTILIDETSDDGRAELTMEFQKTSGRQFIKLLRETDHSWLGYLENNSCADGIIIELIGTSCNLYIVELKRTVNDQKWTGKIRKQFRGATLRALAFLSSLGIKDIMNIEYFTAYVTSYMDQHIQAAKAKQKISNSSIIGKKAKLGIKDEEVLEWELDEITVFNSKFTHHKVELQRNANDIGIGNFIVNN